ncbi:hypothetical protein BH09ACT7_BH09ACT7_26930 [soil metagenome]
MVDGGFGNLPAMNISAVSRFSSQFPQVQLQFRVSADEKVRVLGR